MADQPDTLFKIEFDGHEALEWHRTADGVRRERRGFTASVYVEAPPGPTADLRERFDDDPKVVGTARERKFTALADDERTPVIRVDLERVREAGSLAREVRQLYELGRHRPGTVRLYDVDLSPQFRYCVATGQRPVPDQPLSTFSVRIGERALADRDLSRLEIDGEVVHGEEPVVLRALSSRLHRADPDVLVLGDGELVPVLHEAAAEHGLADFRLGREPGFERLAGANTVESYGMVLHSPARYDVPGRVLVDGSASFLWNQSNLAGLFDLVGFSWKPLQETARASIGNVLTAIQLRLARARDVLAPWNKWQPEAFKDVGTLHAADRGGFTFAPDVGLHEDVVELDFSSLYPRIICEHNISPDTILCDCHADRADVPELGYNVCDERGFLVDVLEPLLELRRGHKDEVATTDDSETVTSLRARSNALKWILVSCFGYQGYRNSKFGRIECHEAINAVARDTLLTAKEHCEAGGWRVVHGLVDSLWIAAAADDSRDPHELAASITAAVDVPLDVEARYDWVAFVPKRGSRAGALTKYFGKRAVDDPGDPDRSSPRRRVRAGDSSGREAYKYRGIEVRQRSTPDFVADAQLDCIDALDETRDPAAVCERLRGYLRTLRAGDVDPAALRIRKRVRKRLGEYTQQTHTVAALQRAERHPVEYHPGQDVRYVVVDDDARSPERVRLHFEAVEHYDADYYADLLVRAAESVVSPLGWDRTDVRRHLDGSENATLASFT